MKKVCLVLVWVIISLTSFALIASAAEKTKERRYPLPGHGSLQMKVPTAWKEEIKQQADNLPPTISFQQTSGAQFLVAVMPFWKESEAAPDMNDYAARKMVQRAVDAAQPNAKEKTIQILRLEGFAGKGYYFSATAKSPEPGSAKYITQGILLVDELAVSFVIFTNDGQKDVESAALEMVKGAIHVHD